MGLTKRNGEIGSLQGSAWGLVEDFNLDDCEKTSAVDSMIKLLDGHFEHDTRAQLPSDFDGYFGPDVAVLCQGPCGAAQEVGKAWCQLFDGSSRRVLTKWPRHSDGALDSGLQTSSPTTSRTSRKFLSLTALRAGLLEQLMWQQLFFKDFHKSESCG